MKRQPTLTGRLYLSIDMPEEQTVPGTGTRAVNADRDGIWPFNAMRRNTTVTARPRPDEIGPQGPPPGNMQPPIPDRVVVDPTDGHPAVRGMPTNHWLDVAEDAVNQAQLELRHGRRDEAIENNFDTGGQVANGAQTIPLHMRGTPLRDRLAAIDLQRERQEAAEGSDGFHFPTSKVSSTEKRLTAIEEKLDKLLEMMSRNPHTTDFRFE